MHFFVAFAHRSVDWSAFFNTLTREKSNMATASGKKNFVLLEGSNDTEHVFSSRQPRGAALKAANRGYTDIRLRERGTNRVHIFSGKRLRVSLPSNAPSWLAGKEKDGKVWKAVVSKVGVERL
jgi:hypothetical protein